MPLVHTTHFFLKVKNFHILFEHLGHLGACLGDLGESSPNYSCIYAKRSHLVSSQINSSDEI